MPSPKSLTDKFRLIACRVSDAAGSVWAFTLALLSVVIWASLGKHFQYSDTWQLVINTSTTIITFLMVFLLQNSQKRSDKASQLKLDELLLSLKKARNSFVNLESMSEAELRKLEKSIKQAAKIDNELDTVKKVCRRRPRRRRNVSKVKPL